MSPHSPVDPHLPPGRTQGQRRTAHRRLLALVAAVIAIAVAVAVGGYVWSSRSGEPQMAVEPGTYVAPSDIPAPSTTPDSSTTTRSKKPTTSSTGTFAAQGSADAPPGNPTRVQVSSGGRDIVDANLQATYLDGEVLAPPFGTAGWYAEDGWPKPGHQGASILVGHINHGSQPDVFWNLPQVSVGDVVTVTYGSGSTVRFKITRSEAMAKTGAGGVPDDASIWDYDNPKPVLRLITCDPKTPLNGGHYDGNWVVWADQLV